MLPIQSDDVILSVAKLTFGYGLVGNLIFGLLSGASCILIKEPLNAASLLHEIGRYRPTVLLAQPRNIAVLLDSEMRAALSSVRVCFSAGESLPAALYNRWVEQLAIPLIDAVGATELGHIFLSNTPTCSPPGSAGRVLPGFSLRVTDEKAQDVQPGERGALLARGIGMASSYLDSPELNALLAKRGWISTGDLASQDVDGFVTIHGRADDMIKLGCGQWIDPSELEALILGHPQVVECAIIGVVDRLALTLPRAYAVLASSLVGSAQIADELRELFRKRWPGEPHKHITDFQFVSALPRSMNGKISRAKLRASATMPWSHSPLPACHVTDQ